MERVLVRVLGDFERGAGDLRGSICRPATSLYIIHYQRELRLKAMGKSQKGLARGRLQGSGIRTACPEKVLQRFKLFGRCLKSGGRSSKETQCVKEHQGTVKVGATYLRGCLGCGSRRNR